MPSRMKYNFLFNDHNEEGFTIVELVISIIILGILAIFVIPKFINLSSDSQIVATKKIAASLSSANMINSAIRNENPKKGVAVNNCTSVAKTLQNNLPSGYTIKSKKVTVGNTINCTLKGPNSTKATFTATGIK